MGDVTWISIEEALQGFFVTPEELSRGVENRELDAKYEDDGERQFLRLIEHQIAAKYERRSNKLSMSKELYGLAAGVTASLVASGIYDLSKAISVQREDDREESSAFDGRVIVLLADDDIELCELIESGKVNFNEFHGNPPEN
ncbi:MAG: hypothetical protein ACPGNV_06270 [Mangrovicoccus sp.]